jgi:predicted nucleic acid-binding protein
VIVVDASAFLSIVLGEPSSDAVLGALLGASTGRTGRAQPGNEPKRDPDRGETARTKRLRATHVDVDGRDGGGSEPIVAPEFLALEVMNSILQMRRRAQRIGMKIDSASVIGVGGDRLARTVRTQFEDLGVTLESFSSRDDFDRTCQIAEQCGLSSYDAVYVAFALQRGARLLTLDRAMAAAAASVGVVTLPGAAFGARDGGS